MLVVENLQPMEYKRMDWGEYRNHRSNTDEGISDRIVPRPSHVLCNIER